MTTEDALKYLVRGAADLRRILDESGGGDAPERLEEFQAAVLTAVKAIHEASEKAYRELPHDPAQAHQIVMDMAAGMVMAGSAALAMLEEFPFSAENLGPLAFEGYKPQGGSVN